MPLARVSTTECVHIIHQIKYDHANVLFFNTYYITNRTEWIYGKKRGAYMCTISKTKGNLGLSGNTCKNRNEQLKLHQILRTQTKDT